MKFKIPFWHLVDGCLAVTLPPPRVFPYLSVYELYISEVSEISKGVVTGSASCFMRP